MKKDEDFLYCSNMKCPHVECLRHNVNTPYNVIIYRRRFVNKGEECKGKVTSIQEKNGVL